MITITNLLLNLTVKASCEVVVKSIMASVLSDSWQWPSCLHYPVYKLKSAQIIQMLLNVILSSGDGQPGSSTSVLGNAVFGPAPKNCNFLSSLFKE